jgi:hypothetical protein
LVPSLKNAIDNQIYDGTFSIGLGIGAYDITFLSEEPHSGRYSNENIRVHESMTHMCELRVMHAIECLECVVAFLEIFPDGADNYCQRRYISARHGFTVHTIQVVLVKLGKLSINLCVPIWEF